MINDISPVHNAVGNGVATSFALPYSVKEDNDILVYKETAVGSATFALASTPADYTISGTPVGGPYDEGDCSIVFGTAPANTLKLLFVRQSDKTQPLMLPANGAYNPKSLELGLDSVVRALQEVLATVTRSTFVPYTFGGTFNGQFQPVAERFLRVNATGDGIQLVPSINVTDAMLADGDYGDITVSGDGATWTIDPLTITTGKIQDDAVTYAKMQNVSAAGRLLGRFSSGSGNIEEVTLSNDFSISSGQLRNERLNFITGCIPTWGSTSTVTIPPGQLLMGDNITLVTVPSLLTIDITVNGANGLDTGAAANAIYYPWVIYNPSTLTAAGLLSLSSTAPTLPSGFILKRQLRGVAFVRSGGTITRQTVVSGWPERPQVIYDVNLDLSGAGTKGGTNVLNNGNQTSYTDVVLSGFIPPTSRSAILAINVAFAGASNLAIRPNGSAYTGFQLGTATASSVNGVITTPIPTDSSQIIEYAVTSASAQVDIDVAGYIVTEV